MKRGITYQGANWNCDGKTIRVEFGNMKADLNIATGVINSASQPRVTEYKRDEYMHIHVFLPHGMGEIYGKCRDGIHRMDAMIQMEMYQQIASIFLMSAVKLVIREAKEGMSLYEYCSGKENLGKYANYVFLKTWAEAVEVKILNAKDGVIPFQTNP